jgi:hypothetical protein
MGKFAETAAADLSPQRSMSPAAAVAADDVEPFFAIQSDPSCGNERPHARLSLSLSRIGESHAAGRLLD